MKPDYESKRLETLRGYMILDTFPEPSFDSVTKLASYLCRTPTALISFVDADREWFKSRVGFSSNEISRDVSFCSHAIKGHDLFVVEDTKLDKRFAQNPLVTLNPKIRFYAAVPLSAPEGHCLGALCVTDRVPRTLSAEQAQILRALARQVVAQLEIRRSFGELKSAMTNYVVQNKLKSTSSSEDKS